MPATDNAMPQVSVTINGRQFRMACEDGEEAHLQKLAADLDQRIGRLRRDCAQDPLDDVRVVQEVLPEALLGQRGVARGSGSHGCLAMSLSASSSAACRLPTSALPVPARSSAVP